MTMADLSSKNMLLKNGVVLIHDSDSHVVASKKDILIENGKIAKIGADIRASVGVQVIDCTDKIVSPGFVDTHHHGWQTQLKGRHANESLLEYMVTGEFHVSRDARCALLTPESSR
jgi:cytosine/adenosine deaminase-related metal-dependent hydrolase